MCGDPLSLADDLILLATGSTMQGDVTAALERFFSRLMEVCPGQGFNNEADPDWPSDCEFEAESQPLWRPVRQQTPVDFSGLSNALEVPIHPDIQAFYNSFWSEHLLARTDEGDLTLLQLWSDKDFDRLRENIIGHALAKRRLKHDLTVFIGTTEEAEFFLSIDNQTGCILLEEPGKPPIKQVEQNIIQFLDRMTPLGPVNQA